MSPPPAADNNASSSSLANRADAASPPRASSFFARLGARRPRTASKIHQVSFAASTSNLLSPSANGSSFSDLLRSSSSSQVHLASSRPGTNSPRPTRISLQTTYTSPTLERVPQGSSSGNTNMTSTNASSPQAGGSALGRMFRRYSQGGAARSNLQGRPSTRDRDSFSVSRNTSSSALDRDIGSPLRPSTHAAVSLPSVPRSNSAILSTVPSNDSGAGIPASRTLPTLAAAEAPAFPSPAIASAITNTQTLDSSSGANTASSANAIIAQPTSTVADTPVAAATGSSGTPTASRPLNGMHRIRLVPHLEATRSLHFEPIERDLKEGAGAVKVGRFTDRQPSQRDQLAATLAGATGANHDATSSGEFGSVLQTQSSRGQPGARGGAIPISGSRGGGGRIDSSRIAFKSKVVSRGHAEIWCEAGGKFFIRDTKSSSGTFLNHIRLSGPNMESRPFAIKDGDVVQLGVDYQGGTEEIYRCVKMRVELNRGWQREASQFNVNALRQLRALQGTPISPPEDKGKTASAAALLPTNRQGVSVTDCCICLFSVTVCQALFIAPCSHVFHYKCIRPLLNLHHPGFSCPLCRTFADLDADVEEDEAWQEALLQEAAAAEARLAQGKQPFEVGTPAVELDAPITAAMLPSLTSALTNDARADGPTTGSALGRLPLATGSSALPAELHAAHATANPLLGRGTAALSERKNDWARPDTAVGSSVGPLGGDKTFAMDDAVEPAGVSNDATHITAELGEMVVTDRLLNEDATVSVDPAALVPSAALQRTGPGAGDAGSPVRRGSGPIAIGNAHRAMPSSSSLARPTGLGSLEEGWPSVGAVGGFSPGLEESGTPLNHTFLSTLAEAPQVNTFSPSATTTTAAAAAAARNFPPGRSAPAQILVPATIHSAGTSRLRTTAEHGVSEGAVGEYGGRGKRSSDGGEDVDTAEEEMGGASLGTAFTNAAAHQKGKARLDTQVGESQHDVALGGDGSIKLPIDAVDRSPNAIIPTGARGRSRSRSRSRAGKEAILLDSDDPFQPCEHPPVPRTGPNLNASAYMSHQQSTHGARQVSTDRSFNLDPTGGGNGSGDSVLSPTSPASESKMAPFKRCISHAM
ncbi:related to component of the spindle assembly checkpoint dma1 [Ustilago bromivora]|uniref:Related to component of the spindle assembly checkpoint dma1 n=1 Tax=Ustilago bromivora TaxID=307758 RepID=A0A1K0G524_9BASI|nr:related to component of the spindle assembly checkpoint dma1 [Ustilago bromivora]SYW81224.1 related to component of the spindle assembly checkpoint dma1 [Ustilago bromivora]